MKKKVKKNNKISKLKEIAMKIGNFQSRFILTAAYFLVIPFFAFIYKVIVKKTINGWIVYSNKELIISDLKKEW